MNTHTKRKVLNDALLNDAPGEALRALAESGVLDEIVPEIKDLKMELPDGVRHKDNYLHTLKVVDNASKFDSEEKDLTLRMAALLHDIGKPATRSFDEGKPTFYGHDAVGAQMSRKRLTELGYDEEFIRNVTLLVELHMRTFGYYPGKWADAAVRRYITDAGDQLKRLNFLIRSDATTGRAEKAAKLKAAMDDLESRIEAVTRSDAKAALRPALNGAEVMKLTGLSQGPELGLIMKPLVAKVRSGEVMTREQTVDFVLAKHAELKAEGLLS